MSYCYYVKPNDDIPVELLEKFDIETGPVIFRGNSSMGKGDVAKKFMEEIVKVALKIENILNTNVPIKMSEDEKKLHREIADRGTCPLCKSKFNNNNNLPVRDHDHLTGKYRGTVCSKCNLQMVKPNFVPIFFHNLSGYDSHFLVLQLGLDTKSINVIPNTEEKFISFTKYVSNNFQIRFVDTFRFMATSLEKLVINLAKGDKSKFRETGKIFNSTDMDLVTRKGVYPYEYTDGWEKLDENILPRKEDFYNTLTETDLCDEDYEYAKRVWDHFNFNTLGEYSDWYMKVDVMLLCDVFENFRDLCLDTYGLDPNYYYTAPGMSFDCMLKYTKVQLQLLSDYDQLLMMEAGVRGGLTQASMRYARANNSKVPDYDPSKPNSWIAYLDATNLYGWAMSQFLPKDGFSWYEGDLSVKNILKLLENSNETSEIGYSLEVDLSYPKSLHDKHNDLPYLPERIIPPGSKIKKLVANLKPKKHYVVHYMALKQALKAGLILEKVHRVFKFKQSAWLSKYIELNTNMRKNARNDFEREFFKLMNNAVFGKTMENVRNRLKMKLVSDDKTCAKLINRNTFRDITIYSQNLAAIHLDMDELKFDKPIYVGFSILDISKTLIYDFHYNYMIKSYGSNIELMYTDTDSLIYYIKTADFYADLLNKPNLLKRMDTSNLPIDHPCYCIERKKLPGTFTDEAEGEVISEFIALKAKSYSFRIVGKNDIIKAKGIRAPVVKHHMTFEDHKKCLFWRGTPDDEDKARKLAVMQCNQFKLTGITATTNQYTPFRINTSLRSFKHEIKTISTVKLALNRSDDKRIVLENQINTLAHGHFRIEEAEELDRLEAELLEMMEDRGY
eukprot:XP_008181781.2 PREDICTED: uncharacterized protein LOC103309046 [Acyrthosiphon pisum]